jgi:hypothetical protein
MSTFSGLRKLVLSKAAGLDSYQTSVVLSNSLDQTIPDN